LEDEVMIRRWCFAVAVAAAAACAESGSKDSEAWFAGYDVAELGYDKAEEDGSAAPRCGGTVPNCSGSCLRPKVCGEAFAPNGSGSGPPKKVCDCVTTAN
jgi:hypothetical protein